MAANKSQSAKFIEAVVSEASRFGFSVAGESIDGGKGSHGKVRWSVGNFVMHDTFTPHGNKHCIGNQFRKIRTAHAIWQQNQSI